MGKAAASVTVAMDAINRRCGWPGAPGEVYAQ